MGSSQSTTVANPQQQSPSIRHPSVTTTVYLDPREAEVEGCCGLQLTKHAQKQAWRISFENNCQQIWNDYPWVDVIYKTYTIHHVLPRAPFLKEANALRYKLTTPLSNDSPNVNINSAASSNNQNIDDILEESVLFKRQLAKKQAQSSSFRIEKKSTAIQTIAQGKQTTRSIYIRPMTQDQDESVIFSKKARKHYNQLKVSFLDESVSELLKPEAGLDIQQQAKDALIIFVNFASMLDRHIKDRDNTLYYVQFEFVNYIWATYKDSKNTVKLQSDIKQFVTLLAFTVIDYYKLEQLQDLFPSSYQLLNQQNLINAVTSILFKEERFYQVVEGVYKRNCKQENIELERIMSEKRIYANPQQLKISAEYCLNKKTVDWYVDRMGLETELLEQLSLSAIQDFSPYSVCIEKLRQITSAKSPVAKLKVILSTAQKIEYCIAQFYRANGFSTKGTIIIGADDVLSIFTYITVESGITDINSHLKMVLDYTSEEELKGRTGYFFNVVVSAVQQLVNNYYKSESGDKNISAAFSFGPIPQNS